MAKSFYMTGSNNKEKSSVQVLVNKVWSEESFGYPAARLRLFRLVERGSLKGMVFGFPDNFRSEELIFDIVPFCSGYHALLGRTAFARFNAVPHYAYLKLKMPGPRGIITVNGNTERSLQTGEHTAALAAEVQSGPLKPHTSSAIKLPDFVKRVSSVPQASDSVLPELD